MLLRKCLEKRLLEIKSIGEIDMITPNIPAPVFIEEAYTLYEACQPDREALCSVGLDWAMVEDLPERVLACLAAYSQWRAAETVVTQAECEHQKNLEMGWELLNEIQQAVLYACRIRGTKHPESLKRSYLRPKPAIMVKELLLWAEYANTIKKELESIRFDMSKIETTLQIVPKLRAGIAQSQVERPAEPAQLLKDQACAWLHRPVELIRAAGKHAFRHNHEKRKVYESEYRRMHRNKGKLRAKQLDAENDGMNGEELKQKDTI